MEPSGIFRTNGEFINIVPQIGSIKLLQRLIQVLGAVYLDSILFNHHPEKALAELDIHIFQERTIG